MHSFYTRFALPARAIVTLIVIASLSAGYLANCTDRAVVGAADASLNERAGRGTDKITDKRGCRPEECGTIG